MLRLSRAIAATDTKVLLTGDGGDDVFLGYPRHELLRRTQAVADWLPPALGSAWRAARRAIPQRGMLKRATHLIDFTTGGLPAFLAANPGYRDFQQEGLLGERLASTTPNLGPRDPSVRAARTALADYLAYDRQTQFVSEYLVKVDGSTMHYALEARSPFLDQELWSFASSLPFPLRLHGGTLKAILREIARRRVGPRVAHGKKRGFEIPVQTWMGGKWHAKVAERLQDSLIVADGWVREEPLQREIESARRLGRASRRLWYLWTLEEWLSGERTRQVEAVPYPTRTSDSFLTARGGVLE
jgi:asparagine synthase (glutamine-hydrolysing)